MNRRKFIHLIHFGGKMSSGYYNARIRAERERQRRLEQERKIKGETGHLGMSVTTHL